MRHDDTSRMTSLHAWLARLERDMNRRSPVALVDALHSAERLAALVNGLRCDLAERVAEHTHDEIGAQQ
jgi:hypothetical protein